MKMLLSVFLLCFSLASLATESTESAATKVIPHKTKKTKTTKVITAKAIKVEPPCDTKEDILKKLEEKKKTEAETGKAFSLQGGNTGCSIK